jgi:hypothetical protein
MNASIHSKLLAMASAAVLLIFMNGCGPKPEAQKSMTPVAVTNREQAIALARQEVARRGWKEIETGRVHFENGVWEVMLWELPKVPGGHAVVKVATNGAVVEFRPGR